MDCYSFDTLEFGKVKELLGRYLNSPLGQAQLELVAPYQDLVALRRSLGETTEMCRIYFSGGSLSFEGVYDLRSKFERLAPEGSWIDGAELVEVLSTLRATSRIRHSLRNMGVPLTLLTDYASGLTISPELEAELARSLDHDGSVKDSASPKLAKIRHSIIQQRQLIVKQLNRLLQSQHVKNCLQEDFVTQRAGRYVLPVQSKYKKSVAGLQHGKSDSGTTVYIEPFEIVEASNELNELEDDEQRETTRILQSLSRQVALEVPVLAANQTILGWLDVVVAKARMSLDYHYTEPEIVTEGPLILHQARHPLLLEQCEWNEVVANDVCLGDTHDCVLITGPNTGGKTVLIKTLGLVSLMALSGLHVPADKGTRIPYLKAVMADIGDEQSLEQNLSTFSAHVAHLREVLARAQPGVLVLLDEMGAGTDPLEGAALAQAVIEELMNRGAWILAATHLAELKVYAADCPRVTNAAMLFDEETLRPTYQFVVGAPGQSNGLQIAARLGVCETTMEKAYRCLHARPEDAASLLHKLGEELRMAQTHRQMLESEKTELESMKSQLALQANETEIQQRQILGIARQKAEKLLNRLKNRLEHAEQQLRLEQQKIEDLYQDRERQLVQREKLLAWKEAEISEREHAVVEVEKGLAPNTDCSTAVWAERRAKFKKLLELTESRPLGEPEWYRLLRELNTEAEQLGRLEELPPLVEPTRSKQTAPDCHQLHPGMVVSLQGVAQPATVMAVDGKRQSIEVTIGNLTSRVPFQKVVAVLKKQPQPVVSQSPVLPAQHDHVPMEMKVIGKRVEDALPEVERYLDRAMLAGYSQVTIIHGMGTGALRTSIRQLACRLAFVAKLEDGPKEGGGSGQTVVTFK